MTLKSALLVIDAQNAFYGSPSPSPVHDTRTMISQISGVIAAAQTHDVPILFVQNDGPEGHPLEPGTVGWELHTDLRVPDAPVVRKRRPDAFFDTGLNDRLVEIGASHLIIVGNQTEFCIDTTCRRAVSEGYSVTLLSDCHSTWPNNVLSAEQIIAHHTYVLGRQFVTAVTAQEFDWSQA